LVLLTFTIFNILWLVLKLLQSFLTFLEGLNHLVNLLVTRILFLAFLPYLAIRGQLGAGTASVHIAHCLKLDEVQVFTEFVHPLALLLEH
jgi:hypothetical protein